MKNIALSSFLTTSIIVLNQLPFAFANQKKLETSQCEHLAKTGFCKVNKDVMAQQCPEACDFLDKYGPNFKRFPKYSVMNDGDNFFDLVAEDYEGNGVHFSDFEGYITVVANFQSTCTYVDFIFETFTNLRNAHPYLLNILAFPDPLPAGHPPITECHGFKSKGKIIVMKEGDVNDPKHPVYGYLTPKFREDKDLDIDNATFFLVDPNGNLEMHTLMNSKLLSIVVNAHVRNDPRKEL